VSNSFAPLVALLNAPCPEPSCTGMLRPDPFVPFQFSLCEFGAEQHLLAIASNGEVAVLPKNWVELY